MEKVPVEIDCMYDDACVPVRGTDGSACYDIFTPRDVVLKQGVPQIIKTGIRMKIPPGYGGFIQERSSLACTAVSKGGGVIDSDYRGEIGVILTYNGANDEYKLSKYDRIAQFMILPVPEIDFTKWVDESESDNQRGEGGFGSTGK